MTTAYLQLVATCRRLLAWEEATGGWEAPVWAELREALDRIEREEQDLGPVLALLEAADTVVDDADWALDLFADPPQALVRKHDLVALEAAACRVAGRRLSTPDGYPHAGSDISSQGRCEVGFCPCHDADRQPQPSLPGCAA